MNDGKSSEALTCALSYARRGWRVFPVYEPVFNGGELACSCNKGAKCRSIGKHPRLMGWQHEATTDERKIREWWRRWPEASVGIVTGSESGIIVLDIDPRNQGDATLEGLERKLGPLPDTLEVLTGGGGQHRYFRHPNIPIQCGKLEPGIDVKHDRGFVVAPPSLHSSGREYHWELSSDPDDGGELAELPERWLERLGGSGVTGKQQKNLPDSLSPCNAATCRLPCNIPSNVAVMMKQTLPRRPGERHACLGRFARGLKFNLNHAGTDHATLVGWAREWHRLATPRTSGNHSADDSVLEFFGWWHIARVPLGQSPVDEAAAAIAHNRPWADLGKYFEDEPKRQLLALCIEMQRQRGDGWFPLSCRDAARAIGHECYMTVARWLKEMCAMRLLELLRPGLAAPGGSGIASGYRLGDALERTN